jgi:hypothetical protein
MGFTAPRHLVPHQDGEIGKLANNADTSAATTDPGRADTPSNNVKVNRTQGVRRRHRNAVAHMALGHGFVKGSGAIPVVLCMFCAVLLFVSPRHICA